MRRKSVLFISSILFIMYSCEESTSVQIDNTVSVEKKQNYLLAKDTSLLCYYNNTPYKVQIMSPKGDGIGCILALPGWNYSEMGWCDSTDLCARATELGYFVVLPYMGKSIYSLRTYDETRSDWKEMPTRRWLIDMVIPDLNKSFGLFEEDKNNFVLGLSTGARGAFFMLADLPNVFKGGALLSGDYNQLNYPSDNLYKGWFGNMSDFYERWSGDENPIDYVEEMSCSMYIGHGYKDKIVPIEHSKELVDLLTENKQVSIITHFDMNSGHDYTYWNSEVDHVLEFFKNCR